MTSHQEKCGLSSLLSMSCREQVEAFTHGLNTRLTSLNSEEISGVANETSWLSNHKNSITISQPVHTSECNFATDFYLNLASPDSPDKEPDTAKFKAFINKSDLTLITSTACNGDNLTNHVAQYDSDSSDGPFYDCQTDLKQDTESTDQSDVTDISDRHLKCKNSVLNFTSDEDDEATERIPHVRRCSSLKTGKTPPGTPGQKKIVRFADVLGLDLADVRTFLDEIPKIPNSAFNDLTNVDIKPSSSYSVSTGAPNFNNLIVEKILVPLFQQPGGQVDFIDRVRDNNVCLDSALIEDPSTLLISGIVRVKNLDFHKSVHVRYTLDSWQDFADVQAVYIKNSCDGFSDRFSFLLDGNKLLLGQKLEFAVRFHCKGCQYWDSNNGNNYSFQCLPATTGSSNATITIPDDSMAINFY